MNTTRTTQIGIAVAAVALAAGSAAFAASKLHGHSTTAKAGLSTGWFVSSGTAGSGSSMHFDHHGGPGRGPGDDLAAAATYLGISQDALVTDLQSGKTLAQVANATAGKSSSGLIDALVAQEQTELAAAVKAGRITQAQADQISTDLKARVTAHVNGTFRHGPHGGPGMGHGDDLAAAATYLGISQDALVTDLQSGKTLAQVADATAGKSSSGLIDALVAQEQTELAAAVKAGRITQAQADQISTDLKARVTAHVNGTFRDGPHGGPGMGGPGMGGPGMGPGGAPPAFRSSGSGGTHI